MGSKRYNWTESSILVGLQSLGISYKPGAKGHILVQCTNPTHDDKNPSMSVNVSDKPGVFRCWSCGHKGHIGAEFKYLGYDPTVQMDIRKENTARLNIIKARSETSRRSTIQPPKEYEEVTEFWRSMHPGYLAQVAGARLWNHKMRDFGVVRRLWLPIFFNGLYYGFTARIHDSSQHDDPGNSCPKYYISPNFPSEEILYLYDLLIPDQPIILVEGHVDALWLRYIGYNALAIMGTETWSTYKLCHLLAANPPQIYICMDSDAAGRKAANRIRMSLLDHFPNEKLFLVELPEGKDPDDLSEEYLDALFNIPKYSYKMTYEANVIASN